MSIIERMMEKLEDAPKRPAKPDAEEEREQDAGAPGHERELADNLFDHFDASDPESGSSGDSGSLGSDLAASRSDEDMFGSSGLEFDSLSKDDAFQVEPSGIEAFEPQSDLDSDGGQAHARPDQSIHWADQAHTLFDAEKEGFDGEGPEGGWHNYDYQQFTQAAGTTEFEPSQEAPQEFLVADETNQPGEAYADVHADTWDTQPKELERDESASQEALQDDVDFETSQSDEVVASELGQNEEPPESIETEFSHSQEEVIQGDSFELPTLSEGELEGLIHSEGEDASELVDVGDVAASVEREEGGRSADGEVAEPKVQESAANDSDRINVAPTDAVLTRQRFLQKMGPSAGGEEEYVRSQGMDAPEETEFDDEDVRPEGSTPQPVGDQVGDHQEMPHEGQAPRSSSPEGQYIQADTGEEYPQQAGGPSEGEYDPMSTGFFDAPHHVEINLDRMREMGMVTPDSARSKMAEEYRLIKRPLLQNIRGEGETLIKNPNLIMVTSSLPGEGKTFSSVNLAMSLAMEMDRTVLLVDADVAKPSFSRVFDMETEAGFIDLLLGEVEMSDVLLTTNVPKLRLLPAGRRHANSVELLASDAMRKMAVEMATRYKDRIIVFDSPPLLATTEAAVLANLMTQIVVVAEANKTPQFVLQESLGLLDQSKYIGLILNKARQSSRSGYYYDYRYPYYYGYGYGS